jgi:hypothetical protein
MKEIRLPPGTVQLAAWATAAAGHEQLVMIEQAKQQAVLTVATPLRIARLSAAPGPGLADAGPLAIRSGELLGSDLADARQIVVVQLSPELAAVMPAAGSPHTVTIVQATLPDATSVIDRAEGEAASGMTKAVAVVPPDYLRQVADAAEGIGCTAVQIIFAPRFGAVLATADAPGCTAAIVISTDGHELLDRPAPPAAPASKGITFNVQAPGPRRGPKPKRPEPPPWEGDLPF